MCSYCFCIMYPFDRRDLSGSLLLYVFMYNYTFYCIYIQRSLKNPRGETQKHPKISVYSYIKGDFENLEKIFSDFFRAVSIFSE